MCMENELKQKEKEDPHCYSFHKLKVLLLRHYSSGNIDQKLLLKYTP